jgi:hypothetical protein
MASYISFGLAFLAFFSGVQGAYYWYCAGELSLSSEYDQWDELFGKNSPYFEKPKDLYELVQRNAITGVYAISKLLHKSNKLNRAAALWSGGAAFCGGTASLLSNLF